MAYKFNTIAILSLTKKGICVCVYIFFCLMAEINLDLQFILLKDIFLS